MEKRNGIIFIHKKTAKTAGTKAILNLFGLRIALHSAIVRN